VQRPKPLTDFYGEDRHELVQKLAYQLWEKRGSPLGSPEIDRLAAEKTVRAYLLASGIELGPNEDLYPLSGKALNIEHERFHNLEN
jgi:hypothetical protein